MALFDRWRRPAAEQNIVNTSIEGHVLSVRDVAGDVRIVLGARRYRYWCYPLNTAEALTRADAVAQPSLALHPRYAVVPLVGRDTELDELRRWLDTEDRLAVTLIHAEGGHGKTRLAEHLRRNLTGKRWVTQRVVHTVEDVDESATIDLDAGQGLLLIVDDAHRWPHSTVEALLVNLRALITRTAGIRVRVLLLARTTEAWWPVLATTLRDWGVAESTMPLRPPGVSQRGLIFDTAFAAYRDLLYGPPPPQVRRREPAHHRTGLDLTATRHRSTLGLHITALGMVHARITTPGTEPVSTYLLDSERTEWAKRYDAGLITTPPQTMRRLVYLATLTRGMPRVQARTLLTLTGIAGDDTTADNLIDDHARCYPPTETVLNPLQPDVLGEDFLALLTPGRPDTTTVTAVDDWVIEATHTAVHRPASTEPPPAWAGSVLATLVEAACRWPHLATSLLYPILTQDPLLAVCADSTTLVRLILLPESPTPVLQTLHQHLTDDTDRDNSAVLAALDFALLPHHIAAATDPARQAELYLDYSQYLRRRHQHQKACGAAAHAVILLRALAGTDPVTHRPRLADALTNYAKQLSQAGHPREALAPASEAVDLLRSLADTAPTAHRPRLADALTIYANQLSRAGHLREALAPASEAIDLLRPLADTAPIIHRPDLADALTSYANLLGRAGHLREGMASAGEAVDLLRVLADTDPAARRSRLADALTSYANLLGRAEHPREAMAPAGEAVDLLRVLADIDPTIYRPRLAGALTSYANQLGWAGHPREAMEPASEAIDLLRPLADTDPAAHRRRLADALTSYANQLLWAGNSREGMAPAGEAVDLLRVLADTDLTTHRHRLADALTNYANQLSHAGNSREGMAPAGEAVDLLRPLADTDPTTYRPHLANTLIIYANLLGQAGRPREALAPAGQAVDLLRPLAGTEPTTYRPRFADALIIYAGQLSEAGRPREGVAPAGEAVDLLRPLAEATPGRYRTALAQSLWVFSVVTMEAGSDTDLGSALTAAVEAVALLEQLVEQLPAVHDRLLAQAKQSRARILERLTAENVGSDPTSKP
ncbi:tetratricopeptide repeat protein [Nocardia abscessus]|uniref:tetratricopeptide repeat protein n=1 Tax=Nocardia abscessus TaxID=120957 RepID=UPI002456547C|nr:hypothetical protein [Nocardia abscessus]